MSQPQRVLPLSLATVLLLVGTGSSFPEADRYTWETVVADRGPDLEPVAAARCDRDRDGNPDLAIAYGGGGRGALVWIPIHASRLGAPEPPLELPFEPASMVAGDLDADGREELALAVAGTPVLAVVAVAANGEVGAPTFHPLRGVPQRLALEDRPRRDGLPELLVDLADVRLVAGSPLGALAGLVSPVLESLAEAAPEESLRNGGRLLLATRIDADASPELVVAAPGGSVRVGTLLRGTIVVDTTDDSVDFGGAQQVPNLPGADGKTTLREAIIAANNTPGPHSIQFNIPQAGNDFHDNAWWISPSDGNLGPLPAITTWGVTVDGGSQTANQGDTNPVGPELVLDGSGLSSGDGLDFFGSDSALIDLVVSHFAGGYGNGVLVSNCAGFVLKGCYFGTSPDGLSAAPNWVGVLLVGTTGATVGGTGFHGTNPLVADRNLVSGNSFGVDIEIAPSSGNLLFGNYIGTDRTGTAALGSSQCGVYAGNNADDTQVGGTAAGAGNLIAGNGYGIWVVDSGTSGTLIQGNTVGAASGGTSALPNSIGILVTDGAEDTLVGGTSPSARNLVSSNGVGIQVSGTGTTGTLVEGNWIGLDASGTAALGNQSTGIALYGGATNTSIGGAGSGEGNVISGNGWDGIGVGGSSAVSIRGNRIGTDPEGSFAVPNTGAGIRLGGGTTGTTVGGALAGEGNLLSGNLGEGIVVSDPGTDGNVIVGNLIGADLTGTIAIPNSANGGVNVSGGATATQVGGSGSGEGNLIAGNSGPGVFVHGDGTDGTVIQGNRIGVASDGTALGNTAAGVFVLDGARSTEVGGTGPAANEIAYSGGAGVAVTGSSLETRVTGNSIHSNDGLGIDLGEDGVTANDVGDDDEGPNRLVNYPVLASATNPCGAGTTVVTGVVDTASPQLGTVELFVSVILDPTGFGEAGAFLGTASPALDGAFSATLPALPLGHFVTATFTDSSGNTSELSAGVQVLGTPFPPESLHADLATGPAVDLGWVDASFDESSFRLERRAAGGSFAFLTALPADSTSYHDPGPLTAGTTYYYRIRAEAGGCISPWSNVASVTIPGATSAFCRSRITRFSNAQNPHLEHGDGFFGATWRDCDGGTCTLLYARLDATGAILDGPVEVAPWGDESFGSQLVWGGGEWGHLWFERLADHWGLFFQRLDPSGIPLSGTVRLNASSVLLLPGNGRNRGLAWDGAGWGVVWSGYLSGVVDVYYAHLDSNGNVDVAEVVASDSSGSESEPMLQYTGSTFGLVWYDAADGQFHLRTLATDGTPSGSSVLVTASAQYLMHPDLVWNGGEYGLIWVDARDGDYAIYVTRFDAAGSVLSPETRLSDPNVPGLMDINAYDPVLRFLGDRWVVASEDWREAPTRGEIQLSTADLSGAKVGSDVIISGPPDGLLADFPALAWNGANLLALWHEVVGQNALEIHGQATDADGNAGSNPRQLLSGGHGPSFGTNRSAQVAFLGDGYAVAWQDGRSGLNYDPYLRITDGNGVPVTGEVQVADGFPTASLTLYGPAVAFSGEVVAVAWTGDPDGDGSIGVYLSRFDRSGGKQGSDLLLSDNARQEVDLLWTGEVFLVAWADWRTGTLEIHTAAVAADGTLLMPDSQVSSSPGLTYYAMLAGDGAARAVVWIDNRDGNWELYGAALDRFGARLGDEQRLTDQPALQNQPHVAWSGSEFLLVWQDSRDPTRRTIYARRLSPDLAPIGPETQISDRAGTWPACAWGDGTWGVVFNSPGDAWFSELDASGAETGPDRLVHAGALFPDLTHDGNRFVITTTSGMYWNSEAYLTSEPCAFDPTEPTCPTDLAGDSQSGAAVLTWTPGVDPDFAVDWQRVWRDGTPFAVVEPGVGTWTDPMPTPGTHTYTVTTLNQGGLESAGCAETALYAYPTCIATRDLPDVYGGGTPFTVTVSTDLPPQASTHAVEDAPPAGWSVSNISDGGSWDPGQGRVKWVFFDNLSRGLTYTVTPPAGTTGTFTFSGLVSVDGGSQTTCGDSEVGSGPPHPADVNDDWRMVINEVTGYATAWRTGQTWPEPPNPIPIAYVTNSAYLYRSGELYHYVLGNYPPYAPGTETLLAGDGTAWSTFGAMAWAPATPFAVTVQVAPDAATLAWAAEDEPPAGWTVSGISHGGVFDGVNHKVKWGPFMDHTPRALQYTITPIAGSGLRSFAGTASFDGHDVPVAGARSIGRVLGDVDADDDLDRDDHVALRLDLYGVTPAPLPDVDKDGRVDARDLSEEVKALEVVLP